MDIDKWTALMRGLFAAMSAPICDIVESMSKTPSSVSLWDCKPNRTKANSLNLHSCDDMDFSLDANFGKWRLTCKNEGALDFFAEIRMKSDISFIVQFGSHFSMSAENSEYDWDLLLVAETWAMKDPWDVLVDLFKILMPWIWVESGLMLKGSHFCCKDAAISCDCGCDFRRHLVTHRERTTLRWKNFSMRELLQEICFYQCIISSSIILWPTSTSSLLSGCPLSTDDDWRTYGFTRFLKLRVYDHTADSSRHSRDEGDEYQEKSLKWDSTSTAQINSTAAARDACRDDNYGKGGLQVICT